MANLFGNKRRGRGGRVHIHASHRPFLAQVALLIYFFIFFTLADRGGVIIDSTLFKILLAIIPILISFYGLVAISKIRGNSTFVLLYRIGVVMFLVGFISFLIPQALTTINLLGALLVIFGIGLSLVSSVITAYKQ